MDGKERGEKMHGALHGFEAMARSVKDHGGSPAQQKRASLYLAFRLLRFTPDEARDAVERVMTDTGPIKRV